MPVNKTKLSKLYNKQPKGAASSEEESTFLMDVRKKATQGEAYWKDNWDASLDDLEFLSGNQWPAAILAERELEQRPCLTNNVLPTFVDQVLGDQLQNKPAIKVNPTSMIRVDKPETGKTDTLKLEGSAGKQYELGEVLSGLIKNIEYNCDAETAYDIAFQSAVESGMGYLRVRTDYLADDSFDQDIIIEAIQNQFSVVFDPSAKKRDKSDAAWCFIHDQISKVRFDEQYPGKSSDPISDAGFEDTNNWFPEAQVRVSEYFTREPATREMALFSDGRSMYMDEIEPVIDELIQMGITIVRQRKVKTFRTFWRKITGLNVLEGPIELKCSSIPVIPVWGKSITIKNKTMFRSVIRFAKDAQRMSNYWDSAATESVALAPKAPFIGSEDQIEGREDEWKNANKTNLGILIYNKDGPNDTGPRRQQAAAIPAAEVTLAAQFGEKIKSTLGIYDASLGAQGNETSGKAIIARQRQGDRGSYKFIDNLSKAIRQVGKLVVELIPTVYDTERVVRIKFPDDTEDFVQINQQIQDEQTGKWITIYDLGVVKYDVVVTTGPAFSTQRMEAAESMIQFAQAVPAAAAVMADLIAMNMDWPGADSIAERLKKIVPPEVLSATEREKLAEDMPEQKEPSPEQQVQMAELSAREAEAGAKTEEAKADVFKAQLASEQAKIELQAINDKANSGGEMALMVKDLVAQAIAELAGPQ